MLNVLVSLITDDNDYQLEQAASAQAAALKLGAKVQIIYSGNDAVQQTQQILTFIQDPAKRPDAILAEAGGRLTDLHGGELAWRGRELGNRRGLIASNGLLHDQVVARLAELFPGAGAAPL